MIVAQPNCSASWRANLYTLLALCTPSLGAALYYVNWKLQYRHIITLGEFLNRDDTRKLIALLRKEIRVDGDSSSGKRRF